MPDLPARPEPATTNPDPYEVFDVIHPEIDFYEKKPRRRWRVWWVLRKVRHDV